MISLLFNFHLCNKIQFTTAEKIEAKINFMIFGEHSKAKLFSWSVNTIVMW